MGSGAIPWGLTEEPEPAVEPSGDEELTAGSSWVRLTVDATMPEGRADDTMWRALELELNLDNGLAWYLATRQERGGEVGRMEALRRVAALPGSWRAQLWLGRAALEAGDLEGAVTLYRQILARMGEAVPSHVCA